MTVESLQAMGFALALWPVTLLWATTRAGQQALATMRTYITPRQVPALAYADFTRVVGLAAQQSLGQRFGA